MASRMPSESFYPQDRASPASACPRGALSIAALIARSDAMMRELAAVLPELQAHFATPAHDQVGRVHRYQLQLLEDVICDTPPADRVEAGIKLQYLTARMQERRAADLGVPYMLSDAVAECNEILQRPPRREVLASFQCELA